MIKALVLSPLGAVLQLDRVGLPLLQKFNGFAIYRPEICTAHNNSLAFSFCRNPFPFFVRHYNRTEPSSSPRRAFTVIGMGNSFIPPTIDEYLRKRLMPVEGAISQLPGIEMYGISFPAEAVGGDLFEYTNFQQRYDIDGRIRLAIKRSQEFLEELPAGASSRNSVDDHVKLAEIACKERKLVVSINLSAYRRGQNCAHGRCLWLLLREVTRCEISHAKSLFATLKAARR